MTELGSVLAGVAVACLVLGARSRSSVGRRLDLIAPARHAMLPWRSLAERDLRHAGIALGPEGSLALRLACVLAGLMMAAVASLALPVGPLIVLAAGYAGWLAPSLAVGQRAERRRREADRALIALVERLEALVAAGRPPETALALLIGRPTGSVLLDLTVARVREAYALGAPLFRSLAHHAREEDLGACLALAEELERARDLGTGSLAMIRERRGALRSHERARSLGSASQVEGKLMLVLVLCYLPALILLVVIPLFVSILEGLFA